MMVDEKNILGEVADNVLFLQGYTDLIGIGCIKKMDGYQRVNINLGFLKEAIGELEQKGMQCAEVFVKTDNPLMIGKKCIGILIAPRNFNDDEYRYTLSEEEKIAIKASIQEDDDEADTAVFGNKTGDEE